MLTYSTYLLALRLWEGRQLLSERSKSFAPSLAPRFNKSVLSKSQGLNRESYLTVGSVLIHDCSSDASVGEAYPTAPLLFS